MSNNKHIADTIIDQLGGNRFIAMTGSKDFVWDDKNLTLKFSLSGLAQKKAKGNRMQIQYDSGMDTYHVSLWKVFKPTLKRFKEKKSLWEMRDSVYNVYFDQLQNIFKQWTGLDTHL